MHTEQEVKFVLYITIGYFLFFGGWRYKLKDPNKIILIIIFLTIHNLTRIIILVQVDTTIFSYAVMALIMSQDGGNPRDVYSRGHSTRFTYITPARLT
jgi:hypothetical protein